MKPFSSTTTVLLVVACVRVWPHRPPHASGPGSDSAPPPASPPRQSTAPAWTRDATSGVEWIAGVGGSTQHGASAVLVCRRGGAVEIVDPASGRTGMPAPHAFRGGATPAGAASIRRSLTPLVTRWKEGARRPLAYCFDRFTAAAFRLDDLTLAWSGGEWPDGPAAQAGDPELLRRIAAARDAHWGLLVMRDDGRGACLSRIDGAPLWQFSLPPSPTYDVDMIDTRASVVWPEGDATRYAWLELGADPPTPRLGQTGKLRAFWSAACSSGLLLASPDRVLLMRGDAPRTIYDGRRAGVYRATLCALKSLAAENERVGFVTQDGFVHSASLAYRESWRRALPDVTPEHLAPLVLQFDGGHVLVGYRQTLAAFSAAGEPVAAVGDWCGLTGSARVRDGILEYVASEPAGESFALVSTPLADQMGSNRRPLEGVRTRPQGVVLTRDHVVIAEDRRLSGFPIR